MEANGQSYGYWDLSTKPDLPQSYLSAHKNVVWWTGNSYPGPITPYEGELASFLDGGGRLFLSGQDLLDQAAGTTAFVKNYLHVNWNGTDVQNDQATDFVTAQPSPVTGNLGKVTIDHSVLEASYEDQITPIAPAIAAFKDDSGATDALTVPGRCLQGVLRGVPGGGLRVGRRQGHARRQRPHLVRDALT